MRMRMFAATLILIAPLASRAELIYVDYEGYVTDDEPDRGYFDGDPIAGRLIVDTDLAPPDRDPIHGRPST